MVESQMTRREDDSSGSVDLSQIGRALARRKYWIAGATLGALLLGLAFVTLAKPRYTAEAKVLIENQEGYFTRPDKASTADLNTAPDAEAVQSQVQLLQSRDLARRAIKELNLVGNREFDPQAGGGGALGRVMVLLGLQRDPTLASPEDRVLDTYFEKLTVFSLVKTRVLSVEFSSQDPDMAARAANTIADLYIDVQSRAKRDTARQVAASLASLITDLKTRLAIAENKAENFRLKSGLLVGANNLTITAQQLGDINTQLSVARAQQADAHAKARLIRDMVRQGRVGDVPDVANNDLIRRISEQRVSLRAQMALESRTLLPGHPRIKELTAQVADLEGELRSAAEKTMRTLENDARIAGSRVENLQATLESQKRVAGTANADDVTLRQFDSESRLLKEQLEANTAKFQEAVARENALSTPADARVISRAVAPPLPSFPKKVPVLASVTLAGLIFSMGSVVAGELLSGRAAVPLHPLPRDVPAHAAAGPVMRARKEPALEPVPASAEFAPEPSPPDGISPEAAPQIAAAPSMGPSEASRDMARDGAHLAERIAGASATGHAVVSMMVAPDANVSVAAAAISLARALARNHRTILVNLDAEAREIDELAPSAEIAVAGHDDSVPDDGLQEGLAALLAGHVSFAEVIHRDRLTRLHVLTHGDGFISGTGGLDLVLDALCETYDHVVLVAPVLSRSDMASSLAPYADFAVLATAAADNDPVVLAACADLEKVGAGKVLVVSAASGAGSGTRAVA